MTASSTARHGEPGDRDAQEPGDRDPHKPGDHGPHKPGDHGPHKPGTGQRQRQRPLPPARFAFTGQTWREISYLLLNLPVALVSFVYVVVVLAAGGALAVTVVGLPLLTAGLVGARGIGAGERTRARVLLGTFVDEPSRLPFRKQDGFLTRMWSRLKDPVGWRSLLYGFIRLPWGVLTFTIAFVSLFVLWPVLPFIARGLANADRAMVRGNCSVRPTSWSGG